jgi:glycolate dehydrogenase iron-sulfur subunit
VVSNARAGFAGLDACVHCGFCLQACPTYLATGDESDGPRGRIDLMRGLERGTLPPDDPSLTLHLDRCLGCRACETVCPSGVRYGWGLETARARMGEGRRNPLTTALLTLLTAPGLSNAFYAAGRVVRGLGIARGLSGKGRIGLAMGMLAATKNGRRGEWGVGRSAASRRSERRRRVPLPTPHASAQLFSGCIMSGLFSHVHQATVRTLEVNGYRVATPPGQRCCGALHAHAGREEDARTLARANIAAFAGTEGPVVVNSAGCGALLKEYGHLLEGAPEAVAFGARIKDVTEVLVEGGGPKPGGPLDLAVAYDPPCHLMHAQGVVDPPLAVLRSIPGVHLVAVDDADKCCGSAGLFSLTQPRMSGQVRDAKVAHLLDARADIIVTGNPGCQMQIGAGLRAAGMPTPVMHPVELLALSYQRQARI